MNKFVKKFIEDNIELIDKKDWYEIYHEAILAFGSEDVGEFSQCMIASGINPLEGLDYIPDYFLSDTNVSTLNIPPNCHSICEGAYSYCNSLTEVTIPNNIKHIYDYAFYECNNLQKCHIHSDIVEIGSYVFFGAPVTIVCEEGSLADMYAQDNNLSVEYV